MKHMREVVKHNILLKKIQKAFPECSEEECKQLHQDVLKCVVNKEYVSRENELFSVNFILDR